MALELETVYQRISLVTSDTPFEQPIGDHHNALVQVVNAIAAHDGFEVGEGSEVIENQTFAAALRRHALGSRFRFRQVYLDGEWWKEEGPSLLVSYGTDQKPIAIIQKRHRYHMQDPQNGTLIPMTAALAADVSNAGFQLYPGFQEELSRKSLLNFSLQNSKHELVSLIGAAMLAMLVALIVPIATGIVVSTAIPDGRANLLIELAALVAAGALGIFALGVVRSLLTIRLETLINMRLQAAIWDRLLRLPSTFFRQYSSGDLVRRVLAIDECRQLLTGPVLGGFLSGIFSIVSFMLMLFYDVRLAIFGVLFAFVATTILCCAAWLQVPHVRNYRAAQGKVTNHLLGLLGGLNKLRLAAAEERGLLQWSVPFAEQQRAHWRFSRLQAMQGTFTAIVGPLGIAGAIIIAGARTEPISLAAFAAFNAAFGLFIASVSSFGVALNALVSAMPLIDRAAPVLSTEPEVQHTASDPGTLKGGFKFHNVSFRYSDKSPLILDNVSFQVEPGEFVALVGNSGAGKSTVLRLLLGFERPTSGTVYYGDYDLSQVDLRLVRQQIGTVLQSAGLLPGSIYDNIAGAQIIADDVVMEAARRAAFADDIKKLPMGLDTFVSEDAGTLSGGQRQRIMIARALVGDPSIVFLDEATSALDNHTQAIVQDSIDRLQVTRLVIAHRLSTIRNADRILVLDDGKIVESGSYEDLMALEGEFYMLAKRQLL